MKKGRAGVVKWLAPRAAASNAAPGRARAQEALMPPEARARKAPPAKASAALGFGVMGEVEKQRGKGWVQTREGEGEATGTRVWCKD